MKLVPDSRAKYKALLDADYYMKGKLHSLSSLFFRGERERKKERKRQRDRQTERQTERDDESVCVTERQRERECVGQRGRERECV